MINWLPDIDRAKVATWSDLKKDFGIDFRLLRDDNEILAEIYNAKQVKNETVRRYGQRLKELVGKMESPPANDLKKR